MQIKLLYLEGIKIKNNNELNLNINTFNFRNFGILKPILYATSLYHHLYRKMSAVMLKKNVVDDLRHLRGKKACFPSFDGYGKTTVSTY